MTQNIMPPNFPAIVRQQSARIEVLEATLRDIEAMARGFAQTNTQDIHAMRYVPRWRAIEDKCRTALNER